ncbi:hypothetical protein [Massilia sp. S19_KUP03_FR1]|uniref:hypothetical protein n=1 Tax=Massilia sp. S19_KUP03_FR1 TaxID=3025503 RepID=UPI002FCD7FF8
MTTATPNSTGYPATLGADDTGETRRSGVSWAAIFAGAASAAALSLILALLGTGLGFSTLSPYEDHSAVVMGVSAILWISLTSIIASGIGGYMAGRLRVKWASVHNDEVFFRDTAHGLLAWAVATLLTAALFGSALGSTLSGAFKTVATVGAAVGTTAATNGDTGMNLNPGEYYTDMLMRSDKPLAEANANPRAEAARIFATSVANGSLAADDRGYLAQTVAARTGMAPPDAEKRVDEVYARMSAAAVKARAAAKEAADKARKAAATAALWLTVSLLLGAFVASLAATFGGRLRDGVAHARPLHH